MLPESLAKRPPEQERQHQRRWGEWDSEIRGPIPFRNTSTVSIRLAILNRFVRRGKQASRRRRRRGVDCESAVSSAGHGLSMPHHTKEELP